MIDGDQYTKIVEVYFEFLIAEFDFKLYDQKIRGKVFYDVQYKDNEKIVSISYENIEDYLLLIVFILKNGQLPDYDDKAKTLHLNKLNAMVLSKIDKNEINLNNNYFSKFKPTNEFERKLLKSAKELRLCLKHFNEIY